MAEDTVRCPLCRAPMELRYASRGRNAGNSFWGCTRFPQCRGSQSVGVSSIAPAHKTRSAQASPDDWCLDERPREVAAPR